MDKISKKKIARKSISTKAQGLSLNVVVMAALALFVLIVLLLIFSDKMRPAADFYGDCNKAGGVVKSVDEDCPDDKPIGSPFVKEKGEKCCISG